MLVEFTRSSACDTATCVEVGHSPDTGYVYVRHSTEKDRFIVFLPDEWATFIAGVKAGEFDID
jgi:hypothetical protein